MPDQLRLLKISSLFPYQRPQSDLIGQLPLAELAELGWQVVWNEPTERCDAWVILDGVSSAETTRCPRTHTLFITAEPAAFKRYDERWLGQFAQVLSCQGRIQHPNLRQGHAPLPWFVKRTLQQLQTGPAPEKTHSLSAVCSARKSMQGHRRRLRCLKMLQQQFPGQIEWFGRKIRFIDDKWEGVAPFRFSLAIENCREADYWTEKIADCFLSYTIPIYDGAPNITDYFPAAAMIRIDTENPSTVASTIERLLADPIARYEEMLPAVQQARERYLSRYTLGARLRTWLAELPPPDSLISSAIQVTPEPRLPWAKRKIHNFRRRWFGTT